MDNRVTIVGGIPQPIGGVTTFIRRLVDRYPACIRKVVDLYPAPEKQKISVEHEIVPGGSLIYLFFLILFSVRGAVYFNFSGARGLIVLALLPKMKHSRWGLTLHNGDLSSKMQRVWGLQFLMRRGVRKCDLLGVLSAKQRQFYKHLGGNSTRMQAISSFVSCDWSCVPELSEKEVPEIASWHMERRPIFIISGYPTKIYQHEEVLNVFIKLHKEGHVTTRLALFLYGEDSDGTLSLLKKRVLECDFAKIYWAIDEGQFLAALKCSAGYIRMNTVDSFGIAVAEAVSVGTPVIATNVCERFTGAEIVEPNDFTSVEAFIKRNTDKSGNPPIPTVGTDPQLGEFLRMMRQ